jgi:hypothetical protein
VINEQNVTATLLGTLKTVDKNDSSSLYQIAETIFLKYNNNNWQITGGHESFVLK